MSWKHGAETYTSANPAWQFRNGRRHHQFGATRGCQGAAARVRAAFPCVTPTMLASVEDAPTRPEIDPFDTKTTLLHSSRSQRSNRAQA